MAQVKPDDLKVKMIQTIASCFSVYGRFQKTGEAAYLVKGTKYAAQASVLITLLKDYFPKSLKRDDADKLIEMMDGLSGNIPQRFVDNPSAVTRDIGFITFLRLAQGSAEDKLGKLPEAIDED
ncbi:MAG: hypothetical protein NTZ35_01330 [Ignavibacteriales bacterium]|nr:hypothetical protein [Ignavibacteriales bacterium]